MMCRMMIFLLLIAGIAARVCAQHPIPAAESFLPGIVSSDSLDFNAAFSPDGNSFFFSRSINKSTQLYISTRTGDEWSTPVRLAFSNTDYSDADPAFSPAGELYFISNRPTGPNDTIKDYNIWKVTRTNSGQWSHPINVKELNSPEDEYYISFTKNGDACFSSSRKGGYGQEDIYISEFRNNTFGEPENIGNVINTNHSEYDPFITANGQALIFTSSGRPDSFGKADIYWSVRTIKGWQKVTHFSSTINTPSRDYCPYISQDKKYIFYSTGGDVKILDIRNLPEILLNNIHSK